MATLSAANCLAFSYCSLKAMEKINLSLYSLFSMLGGMALPYAKVSPAGFSLLTLVFCAAFLTRFKAEKLQMNPQAILGIAGNGVFQKTGELLLLIALTVLPASAQYPFITGGTMIVSAIISFFTSKKPSKRELLSISISFIGILMLLLLPEIVIFTI